MTQGPKCRMAWSCALVLAPLAVGLTACSDEGNPLAAAPYDAGDQVSVNAEEGGGALDHDERLEVSTSGTGSTITDVVATDGAGRHVRGKLSEDGSRWHSTTPLAAGVRYTVRVSTENGSGAPGRRTLHFETEPADGRKLGVTFGPEKGTYGTGQPLVAELSHKVRDPGQRRTVERGLQVSSTPHATGRWHWVDDRTLHYRPREPWPEHADITAHSTLEGVKIRDGLRGGPATPLRIRTADRVEAVVNIAGHSMTVKKSGKTLRSIPVTTGKPGFRTRTGAKVVLGKQPFIRMTSGSIGIPAGSSESYDLPVHWNARITQSGEFLHGAPWSAGSHGAANVSHGCTGMSSANAKWFFHLIQRGDVVRYVDGQGERMPAFGNGFGDWNLSWQEWLKGSALHQGDDGGGDGGNHPSGRLRLQM